MPLRNRSDEHHQFQTAETLSDLRVNQKLPKVAVSDALRVAGGVTIYNADGVPIFFRIPNVLGIALGDDRLGRQHAQAVGEEGLAVMQVSWLSFVHSPRFSR